MKKDQFVLILAGTVGCAILAMIFFGGHFTNLKQPSLYLVLLGFLASLNLALFRLDKWRDALFASLLIVFLFFVLTGLITTITAVVVLVYIAGLIAGIYVYSRYVEPLIQSRLWLMPPILAGMLGIAFLIANLVHALMFFETASQGFLLRNMPLGVMNGLGIGLGERTAIYFREKNKPIEN